MNSARKRQVELELKQRELEEHRKQLEYETAEYENKKQWTPVLIFAPMAPVLVMMAVIIVGSCVLNMASTECINPLSTWLNGTILLCYGFVGFYAWLFIGPIRISSLTLLKRVYMGFGVAFGIWFLPGTAWAFSSSPCAETSNTLLNMVFYTVLVYWIIVFILIYYAIDWYLIVKRKGKNYLAPIADPSSRLERVMGSQAHSHKEESSDSDDDNKNSYNESADAEKTAEELEASKKEREAWRNEFYGGSDEVKEEELDIEDLDSSNLSSHTEKKS